MKLSASLLLALLPGFALSTEDTADCGCNSTTVSTATSETWHSWEYVTSTDQSISEAPPPTYATTTSAPITGTQSQAITDSSVSSSETLATTSPKLASSITGYTTISTGSEVVIVVTESGTTETVYSVVPTTLSETLTFTRSDTIITIVPQQTISSTSGATTTPFAGVSSQQTASDLASTSISQSQGSSTVITSAPPDQSTQSTHSESRTASQSIASTASNTTDSPSTSIQTFSAVQTVVVTTSENGTVVVSTTLITISSDAAPPGSIPAQPTNAATSVTTSSISITSALAPTASDSSLPIPPPLVSTSSIITPPPFTPTTGPITSYLPPPSSTGSGIGNCFQSGDAPGTLVLPSGKATYLVTVYKPTFGQIVSNGVTSTGLIAENQMVDLFTGDGGPTTLDVVNCQVTQVQDTTTITAFTLTATIGFKCDHDSCIPPEQTMSWSESARTATTTTVQTWDCKRGDNCKGHPIVVVYGNSCPWLFSLFCHFRFRWINVDINIVPLRVPVPIWKLPPAVPIPSESATPSSSSLSSTTSSNSTSPDVCEATPTFSPPANVQSIIDSWLAQFTFTMPSTMSTTTASTTSSMTSTTHVSFKLITPTSSSPSPITATTGEPTPLNDPNPPKVTTEAPKLSTTASIDQAAIASCCQYYVLPTGEARPGGKDWEMKEKGEVKCLVDPKKAGKDPSKWSEDHPFQPFGTQFVGETKEKSLEYQFCQLIFDNAPIIDRTGPHQGACQVWGANSGDYGRAGSTVIFAVHFDSRGKNCKGPDYQSDIRKDGIESCRKLIREEVLDPCSDHDLKVKTGNGAVGGQKVNGCMVWTVVAIKSPLQPPVVSWGPINGGKALILRDFGLAEEGITAVLTGNSTNTNSTSLVDLSDILTFTKSVRMG